jgi:preprotein translocase subunit SecE
MVMATILPVFTFSIAASLYFPAFDFIIKHPCPYKRN